MGDSELAELEIRSVEAQPMPIPLRRPISSSLGTYETVECVVVRLITEGGPSGVGFTMGLGGSWSAAVASYINDELAPAVIGRDVSSPEAVWHRMWAPNKARMRAGLGVWALSAVDIAVWDVIGKAAGMSIHSLLGGFRNPVPVYGSGGWHDLTDEELVAECETFAALGITAYKYKIGSSRDVERTSLLRSAMGDDFTLLADANQRYDVRGALEVAAMLADFGVGWIEEPVIADSVDDLAEVAARSAVPTAAGENAYFGWGFREMCERRAASYLQPDVARCGGITEFRRVAALADTFRLSLSSHLWHELSISLVGAAPSGWAAEYTELLPEGTFTRPFEVVDGMIGIPDTPGHGVEFSTDAIERWAR
ncbi:MAG TPA: mandelate racemase/muconate lactonizing enzyme family protein [Acidimicrobiia bacterium]|jgi:D-arabinonate dehydratase